LKKDIAVATVAVAVILGVSYLLSSMRPPFKPTPSTPAAANLSPAGPGNSKVIIRVNGQPVTEAEFSEAFRQLPEEMQRQFASAIGKQAFAEQYVRLKLVAEEGEKLGVANEPELHGQLAAFETNALASATLQKLVKTPTDAAVKAYYEQHRAEYRSVELSHIVIAYQGGMIQPRNGGAAPSEQAAVQKAVDLYMKMKNGADFAQVAHDFSDDPASAANGGKLGPVSKGMLPPEIEAQVLKLQPNQVSSPIPSRFGIHLFKTGPPTIQDLDKVRPLVTRQLQQQNAMDRVETLRKSANVEFDPKFFPDAKTWGKQPGVPKAPS
jgi:parvulin-like peptidyl-prolyl isomerase